MGNSQVSVAVAAGGTGTVSAQNELVTSLTDVGIANGQTGSAVAGMAPSNSGAAPTHVDAKSGDATAKGTTAQNLAANSSVGVAQVGGANDSSIDVRSSNTVIIQNVGAANAVSGAAAALPEWPAAGGMGSTSLTQGTSTDSSRNGANVTNSIQDQVASNATLDGKSTVPYQVTQSQVLIADSAAFANSRTAGTCDGAGCWTNGSGPAGAGLAANGGSTASATSGNASSQGVVAQNIVQTDANARVSVRGDNFAPIRILIETITGMFNWGSASSRSGPAVAAGGSSNGAESGKDGPAWASSGNADATGARVTNKVDLESSAHVQVTGDNHTPIDVFIEIVAGLFNWGRGGAQTGAAYAGGGSGQGKDGAAYARSGSAHATGLEAQNLVNMSADASVDIDGSNYAPVTIRIRFITLIENEGHAQAVTGPAFAQSTGGSKSTDANSASNKESKQPQLSPGQSLSAALNAVTGVINDDPAATNGESSENQFEGDQRFEASSIANTSGYAVAIGNITLVDVQSSQTSSANGSGLVASIVQPGDSDGQDKDERGGEVQGDWLVALGSWSQDWQGTVDSWMRGWQASTSSGAGDQSSGAVASGLQAPATDLSGEYKSAGYWLTPTPVPTPNAPVFAKSGDGFCWGNETKFATTNGQVSAAFQPGNANTTASNLAVSADRTYGEANCRSGDTFTGPVPTPTPVPEIAYETEWITTYTEWEIEWQTEWQTEWETISWESWEYVYEEPWYLYAQYELPVLEYPLLPLQVLTIPAAWPLAAAPPVPNRMVPLTTPWPPPALIPMPDPAGRTAPIIVPSRMPNAGDGSTSGGSPLAPLRTLDGFATAHEVWRRRGEGSAWQPHEGDADDEGSDAEAGDPEGSALAPVAGAAPFRRARRRSRPGRSAVRAGFLRCFVGGWIVVLVLQLFQGRRGSK